MFQKFMQDRSQVTMQRSHESDMNILYSEVFVYANALRWIMYEKSQTEPLSTDS
jgi:hypothetical protein